MNIWFSCTIDRWMFSTDWYVSSTWRTFVLMVALTLPIMAYGSLLMGTGTSRMASML